MLMDSRLFSFVCKRHILGVLVLFFPSFLCEIIFFIIIVAMCDLVHDVMPIFRVR